MGADEVVPDHHGGDRVDLSDGKCCRIRLQRLLSGCVPRRLDDAVGKEHSQSEPRERLKGALPPNRSARADETDHGHRASPNGDRDAKPDRPEKRVARELLCPRKGHAQDKEGEDVHENGQERDERRQDGAEERKPNQSAGVAVKPIGDPRHDP